MPIKAPCGPIQRCQPKPTAASTPTRGAVPRTWSRYSLGCGLEQFPARHRHDGGADPVFGERLARHHRDRDLGARGEQRHLARALGLGQYIGAMRRAIVFRRLASQQWQRLAGQCHQRRRVAAMQRERPAFGGLDRVGRAVDIEARDRAQRGQMLDRLVGRAVFAEPDRVVGHHVDDADAHKRRETDRRPAIIGKGQKRPAIGDQPAMHGDAVHRRRHAVLAHPPMHVAARIVAGPDLFQILGARVVGRGQIGRAADQLRHDPGQSVEHRARGLAGRDLGIRLAELVADLGNRLVEAERQLAALAAQKFAR